MAGHYNNDAYESEKERERRQREAERDQTADCRDCGASFPAGETHMCEARTKRLDGILFATREPEPTPYPIPAELAEVLGVSPMDVQGALAKVRELQDALQQAEQMISWERD